MTRHLLGMRTGRAGGRRWRRRLSELGAGHAGLAGLRELVAELAGGPASFAASPREREFAYNDC
jgi:hypothetical protein